MSVLVAVSLAGMAYALPRLGSRICDYFVRSSYLYDGDASSQASTVHRCMAFFFTGRRRYEMFCCRGGFSFAFWHVSAYDSAWIVIPLIVLFPNNPIVIYGKCSRAGAVLVLSAVIEIVRKLWLEKLLPLPQLLLTSFPRLQMSWLSLINALVLPIACMVLVLMFWVGLSVPFCLLVGKIPRVSFSWFNIMSYFLPILLTSIVFIDWCITALICIKNLTNPFTETDIIMDPALLMDEIPVAQENISLLFQFKGSPSAEDEMLCCLCGDMLSSDSRLTTMCCDHNLCKECVVNWVNERILSQGTCSTCALCKERLKARERGSTSL